MVSCSGEVFPRHLLKQLEQVLPSSCRPLVAPNFGGRYGAIEKGPFEISRLFSSQAL